MKKLICFGAVLLACNAIASPAVNYTDGGKKQGVPVVFIHAFPLNQRMWDDQVSVLKHSARVVTFDIRGLGKSKSQGPYTLEFVVDDLISLMDQLKIDKAVVVGLSMGGFVALRAAERNPDRILGLVLADTKAEADSDKSKLGRYEALKVIKDKGLKTLVEDFVKKSLSPDTKAFKDTVDIAMKNSADGVSAALLALTSRTDTTAGLASIHVPTVILQGENDMVIPLESAKVLNEKIPGSRFFIIPKAGHLSNLDNPQAFNVKLTEFVNEFKK